MDALRGCELIIHAGDVGSAEILDTLRTVAPVVAVRGNIDTLPLPESAEALVRGVRIYAIHDVHDLRMDPAAEGFHVVISGHSHKPASTVKNGVLYLNPGAAGPRRFRLPITVATVDLAVRPWEMRLIAVG